MLSSCAGLWGNIIFALLLEIKTTVWCFFLKTSGNTFFYEQHQTQPWDWLLLTSEKPLCAAVLSRPTSQKAQHDDLLSRPVVEWISLLLQGQCFVLHHCESAPECREQTSLNLVWRSSVSTDKVRFGNNSMKTWTPQSQLMVGVSVLRMFYWNILGTNIKSIMVPIKSLLWIFLLTTRISYCRLLMDTFSMSQRSSTVKLVTLVTANHIWYQELCSASAQLIKPHNFNIDQHLKGGFQHLVKSDN